MPAYLRFVRGIVDSEDLPLNVSREMLQHNIVVTRIRSALVRRVFNELKKKAEKAPDEYANFWDNFGGVLKEGLYEDHENREKLLEIVRFQSTAASDITSLAAYVERMKKGQDEIFYISGENIDALKASPQLEGFRAKGVEVLLMTDPVDEFWLPMVGEFDGKKFTSAPSGAVDLSKIKKTRKDKPADDEAEPDDDTLKRHFDAQRTKHNGGGDDSDDSELKEPPAKRVTRHSQGLTNTPDARSLRRQTRNRE